MMSKPFNTMSTVGQVLSAIAFATGGKRTTVVLVILILCSIPSRSSATIVTSGIGVDVEFQQGTTLGWGGVAPVGVVGTLNAHPIDIGFDGGTKSLGAPFGFAIGLGADVHGTTGGVAGVSLITAPGAVVLSYATLVGATTIPGFAEFLPVSTFGFVTDPVAISPADTPFWGSFSMDVILGAGSEFDGIPGFGATESSMITSEARVVPGSFPDPDDFMQPIPGAIDLYSMDITDTAGGIAVSDLVLGASNSGFALAFSTDPGVFDPLVLTSRVENAFSGAFGAREVLNDTYLFTVDVTLASEDMVYTFGPSSGALAPDVEVPEPSSLLLLSVGGLILTRRRRQARFGCMTRVL